MTDLLQKLTGGDRRSLGQAAEVTEEVLANPALLPEILDGIWGDDKLIRSRAAHVLRHAGIANPPLIASHKATILERMPLIDQWEVREQFCILLPHLPLTSQDINKIFPILQQFLNDKSSIVRTCAMQAMVDLATIDSALIARITPIIVQLTEQGTAAMRARGRKLLKTLEKLQPKQE